VGGTFQCHAISSLETDRDDDPHRTLKVLPKFFRSPLPTSATWL
jgi:hypothetical protein